MLSAFRIFSATLALYLCGYGVLLLALDPGVSKGTSLSSTSGINLLTNGNMVANRAVDLYRPALHLHAVLSKRVISVQGSATG